mgnify:CR=1 FL=1
MRDNSKTNTAIARRVFLAATGGLIAAIGSSRAASQPMFPPETMERWNSAPTIRLWPGAAPNGGFKSQPLGKDFPPFFIQNVEQPLLRVFRPAKPNGRSLLIMPGGSYRFVSIANEGVDIANFMTARGYTVFVLVYRLPGEG